MLNGEQAARRPWTVPALGLSWPLVVASAVFLLLLGRPQLLNDGDIYWHVVMGQWILQHLAIPLQDVYSHTLFGSRWTAHEWLSEVLFAFAFDKAGWTGVVMLAAFASALAFAAATRFFLRHLQPIYALALSVLSASLLAPHLVARPHALIAPVIVVWCVALVRARENGQAPPVLLALLMVVWGNLHGSFIVGLGLAGALALEAVLDCATTEARRRAAQGWGLFLLSALAASLSTPFGVQGLLFAIRVDQMAVALGNIGEWRSPDFQKLQPLELWLMVGGAVILARGIRLPAVRIGLVLGMLHLALKHARHADLLALAGPVLLAGPFAAQWDRVSRSAAEGHGLDRWFNSLVPPARSVTVGFVLAVLFLAGLRQMQADTLHPADAVTPQAALHAAREAGLEGPVLNAYEFGGYLIFSGVSPFIDGRTDLYGDEFVRLYLGAVNSTRPGSLQHLLKRYDIGWTLLPPQLPAVSLLDHLPGWRRVYEDATAVVHARNR